MSSIFSSPEPQPGTASPFAVLQATIGNARCERDAQCHTVPVGHRACGGPERYLPWSDAVTDRARLQEAADAYAAERKKEETGSGRMSTCQMLADPGARCDATSQRCVLTIGTGAGAAAR